MNMYPGLSAYMYAHPLLGVLVALVALATLMGALYLYKRRRPLDPEVSRKLFHAGGGLVALTFPLLFADVWPVLALAALTAAGLYALKRVRPLRKGPGAVLYGIERTSRGELYFPLSVGLLFVVAHGDALFYEVPLLILTLADPAAALAGARYGRLRYPTMDGRGHKSVEGSAAFFVVALLGVQTLLLCAGAGSLSMVLTAMGVALTATLAEAVGWRGLDNLSVPLAAFLALRLLPEAGASGFVALIALAAVSVVALARVTIRKGLKMYTSTDRLIWVENSADWERFRALPGPDAQGIDADGADAHWMLAGDDGRVVARCSLWWRDTPSLPSLPGRRIGLIGHYAATSAVVAARLLGHACAELAAHGCALAVGPVDGGTHRRYRLLSWRGAEPPFFLEPDNPDDWPDHFTARGFAPLAHYYSSLAEGLGQRGGLDAGAAMGRLAAHGITIRSLDAGRYEDELRSIYAVAAESFRHNVLYSPLDEEEFVARHRPLEPLLRPELALIAERGGAPVGFLFAIPDYLRARRGDAVDTVVVKTIAVREEHEGLSLRGMGLGSLLVARLFEAAHESGYRRAIGALMREDNVSRRISAHYDERVIRRYTLYSKDLEVRP